MKSFDNLMNPSQLFFMFQFCIFWLIGIFLTTLTHELSHWIIAKLAGWQITAFKPYPHKQWNQNEWVAGSIYYKHNDKNMNYMPAMLCAPLWKAYIMFSLWSILGFLFFPLWAFAICELTDYIEFWCGYLFRTKNTDGAKMRYLMALHNKK